MTLPGIFPLLSVFNRGRMGARKFAEQITFLLNYGLSIATFGRDFQLYFKL